jgi:hypothetical protein
MAVVWSTKAPLLCVHPGARPLTEPAAITGSWAELFRRSYHIEIDFEVGDIQVACSIAWLTGVERVRYVGAGGRASGDIFSMRLYRKEEDRWRLAVNYAVSLV